EHSRQRCVGAEADRQVPANADEQSGKHTADGAAPYRDAAGPDHEDLYRIREIELPAIDDGHDPRPDDAADHTPRRDGGRVFFRDARTDQTEGQPHAEQDADCGEDAVPGDRERTDVDVGIEWDRDHGTLAMRRRRGSCRGSGSSLAPKSSPRRPSTSSPCLAGTTRPPDD